MRLDAHRSVSLQLTVEQTRELDRWIKVGSTPRQAALRAQIVRREAGGYSDKQIAQALQVHPRTAALWRRRASVEGIGTTLQTKPQGASHWSTRSLAKAVGSKNTIHCVWQDHQLKPHLTKSFKLSRDPHFVENLTDIVRIYLQPPQDAVVLCLDEKNQIQALDRTQPGLPLKRGRCSAAFRSVDELHAAINEFLGTWNDDPRPYTLDRQPRGLPRQSSTLPPAPQKHQTRLYQAHSHLPFSHFETKAAT